MKFSLAHVIAFIGILLILATKCWFNNDVPNRINNVEKIIHKRTLDNIMQEQSASSSTGTTFHGLAFREYQQERLFLHGTLLASSITNKNNATRSSQFNTETNCSSWAVVTTINEPTTAIHRVATLDKWCIVIVADTQTPQGYLKHLFQFMARNMTNQFQPRNIHYLAIEDQKRVMNQAVGMTAEFLKAIPYRHFSRKNIGYFYAIQRKAKFIFDFDDDNLLLLHSDGTVVDPVPDEEGLHSVRIPVVGNKAFNHHDLMNVSVADSWARGFPLDRIQEIATRGREAYTSSYKLSMNKIAVMQICADDNPDVDAIHRLTKPLPITFARESSPLLVPAWSAMSPYNAQAAIHTQQAQWATLLPTTVPGRVSDIWRGYFAQAIFRYVGLSLVFVAPIVAQIRNVHNYMADFSAELDLYVKTSKLIDFLSDEWSPSLDANSVPSLMEDLWIALYERGYIDVEDVHLVQCWLGALIESHYTFPKILHRRIDNVALQGQFNYPNDMVSVLVWTQKWRSVFKNIVLYGPWNDEQLAEMKAWRIDCYGSDADNGYVSPYKNLMHAVRSYQLSNATLLGVMYAHDDMMINVPRILMEGNHFPTTDILHEGLSFCFYILPDGSLKDAEGTSYTTLEDMNASFTKWTWWGHAQIMPQLKKLVQDERSQFFRRSSDGALRVSIGQGDLLYMPMNLGTSFLSIASILTEYKIFLECAIPILADSLQIYSNATARDLRLLTSWSRRIRGKSAMYKNYDPETSEEVLIHPVKLSRGLETWSNLFDKMTVREL
jgi:hypothetical protein